MQPNESKQGLRILLLEDVPTDAELVEQKLRSAGIEFVLTRVDNHASFLEALDRFSPEIILSDYSLPAFDGESALSLARDKAPGVPFIFVTGALGEDRAVDLLKGGATDFVLKDRLSRLPLCVKRALEEVEQKRRREQAEEKLRQAYAQLEQEVEDRTGDLRQRTLELQQLTETLEFRVQERTEELRKANEALRYLSSRLLSAQEDERKRIAGELHDSIAASLGAVKFKIERIADEIKGGHGSAESLQDLGSNVTEISNEVRRIMADLRPSILDDLGIIAAVNWFGREYQKTYSHIFVDSQIGVAEDEVPDSLKTPIFRISQEALNNIAKYSKASLVNLSLRREDNQIELTIRDNGQGFSLEKVKRGLGLSTMKERAQLSGGVFDLESALGKGTLIRVSWPIT